MIKEAELRGITIPQLQMIMNEIHRRCLVENWTGVRCDSNGVTSTVPITPETANLYDIIGPIIKGLTKDRKCSFVELVARGPQPPKWFVSHWWGEPVKGMLDCLKQHAFDHGLAEDHPDTVYWVCAYANNQVQWK